ncbi:MAG: hypothetical protein PHE55_03310 [Methylococcaceae bacterium]|nr:hypothetical protein [Methylococcaceae bacterium]
MIGKQTTKHRSIFTLADAEERARNFEDYWIFTQAHSGDLIEEDKDLTRKRALLQQFRNNPVQLSQPFPGAAFYRNYVELKDKAEALDRKTLLLTCIYKFARHEWVGITGAWKSTPSLGQAKHLTDKISRWHLAEEFCHVRFFHEMFMTFKLDKLEWVPLSPFMEKIYQIFPLFPEILMSPPAFVTELMGIVFYREVDAILDEVFADEPSARDRLRALLDEITVDEIAHVGQRRNYIGSLGVKLSKWMLPTLFRLFYADIPETRVLFDIEKMIKTGLEFDFNEIPERIIERAWIPSYCI